MSFVDLMAVLASNSEPNRNEGDYEKAGLLYCGKCNTPKQTEVKVGDRTLKPYCMCKCEAEQYEQEEKNRRILTALHTRELYRKDGFTDKHLQQFTFDMDDGENPKPVSIAKRYVEHFNRMRQDGKGLMFYGTTGTGKTFIAACIVNALLDKGVKCQMTNFPRLINTLSGMYEGKQEFIDGLNSYSLLVIDDLAIERDTEYAAEIVQNIVDSRYTAGKPMIITTNLTYNDFLNPRDIRKQRLYSRLKEMCLPIEVKGKDRREQKLTENFSEFSDLLGL